jgi:hypothetical protein
MRMALLILGAILIIAGLFFACQGAGYFPFPKSSFMVDNSRWITYGLGIAFFGMVIVFIGRRQ